MSNNRPRYGFVQNVQPARLTDKYGELLDPFDPSRTPVEHALYDVVDNTGGSEQVLAYCVRRLPAVLIVEALNAMEEVKRRC